MSGVALRAESLCIERADQASIIENVSLSVESGEILGVVGESGSGKTTTALALLGHSRPGLTIRSGSVTLADGAELIGADHRTLRRIRGRRISYVSQDPATSLDPAIRVEAQIAEMYRIHNVDGDPRSLLELVGLATDRAFRRRFPHQLSGGQQQRLALAVALALDPEVVVLDEPTTALDVVTQSQLLGEIRRLRNELGLAVVYVTHDIAVVASIADRIAVMYAGRVVELGATADILTRPRHPYSRGLIASVPDHDLPRTLKGIPGVAIAAWEAPGGCAFAARCPQATSQCTEALPELYSVGRGQVARCFHWTETPPPAAAHLREFFEGKAVSPVLAVENLKASHGRGAVIAAFDVSFEVAPGECVALVGESGSGKTTIARCIAGLHPPDAGAIRLDGDRLPNMARERSRKQRQHLQIVFQNPYESLNPRRTVAEAVERPIRLFETVSSREAAGEVRRVLELVRLPERLMYRFPHELSGGERQRVAIARALAGRPRVIVCDEITSALDVSVQAVVLDVLTELRRELGLALLLITHDLGVVASVADAIVVLESGHIREHGGTEATLHRPQHEYTRRLLDAAPTISEWQPEMMIGEDRHGL